MTSLPADLSSSPCFILISSQPKGASAVLVNSFQLIALSGFTFITISGAFCKSALPLMSHVHWRQVQFRPFFFKSSGFRSGCTGQSTPRRFIREGKLRVLLYGSVPAHEARVHRLGELRHPFFIHLKGSQPESLHYGFCSKQRPSDQGEFWYFFWQVLVVAPAFLLLSHFVARGHQPRNSRYFSIRLVIRLLIPEFREHFNTSSV